MPYMPINKCLPVTEDIRLQHKFSRVAAELSRDTNFVLREVQLLLQMHHALTTRRHRKMDAACFAEFMDEFLGVRNADAVDKIHLIRCRANKRHLTGREFVELLSLLLKGSLPDTVNFCFGVYTEMIRSPAYVRKEDVLTMARRNRSVAHESAATEQHYRQHAEYVMRVVDKDRDNRISLEDYRSAVNENVAWLQFLGPMLPEPDRAESFVRLFSRRPHVDNAERWSAAPGAGRPLAYSGGFAAAAARNRTMTVDSALESGASDTSLADGTAANAEFQSWAPVRVRDTYANNFSLY